MIANERFPGGIPYTRGLQPHWGVQRPLRLTRILDVSSDGWVPDEYDELHNRWIFVSIEYSKCTLTYETDALPAISGLARAFSKALYDTYLAGIWRNKLIPGLLWYVRYIGDPYDNTYEDKPAREYRGKSHYLNIFNAVISS